VIHRHAHEAQKGRQNVMKNEQASAAANTAKQGAHVAPEKATSKKGATKKKGAPKRAQTAKGAKSSGNASKGAKSKETRTPRTDSKKAKVLALLGRKEGASLEQMMKATGWQAHSVRGFLSGSLGKKMGLTITNEKVESGQRIYRLAK
jgi:hypothetical protein